MTVLQKVGIRIFSSFRRKPESREFKQLQFPWTPVFTGVTTFCVIVIHRWSDMLQSYLR